VVVTTVDVCVYGDSKVQLSSGMYCSNITSSSAWYCYDRSTADLCCETCAILRNASLTGKLRDRVNYSRRHLVDIHYIHVAGLTDRIIDVKNVFLRLVILSDHFHEPNSKTKSAQQIYT